MAHNKHHSGHHGSRHHSHHKYKGSNHSSVPAYNVHGAPEESTPCKIKNITGGAGYERGIGHGHGAGHLPKGGELGGLRVHRGRGGE